MTRRSSQAWSRLSWWWPHPRRLRNYDGQYYTEPVDPGLSFAFTKMLYDEGVTSYARGYCDSGVWTASARTGSF